MPLQLAVPIAITCMASLATLLLGMAERQPLLPTAAILLAAGAIYFNDLRGWVRLKPSGANIACLGAVAISLWDLQRFGRDSQLLAAANLLVYLQVILLYQEKTVRRFWMLALLSLMQVAVAAALGLELSFGLVLFTYLTVTMAAMGLFFAYREQLRYLPAALDPQPALAAASPIATGRWKLLRRPSVARQGWTQSSMVGVDDILSWRSLRLSLGLTAVTLGIAFGVFFVVPRVEQSPWRRGSANGAAVVGIPETVSLSEVGMIYESPEAVMRVQFFDDRGQIQQLREPPLFRGFDLKSYSENRWRQTDESQSVTMPITELQHGSGYVTQKIEVQPSESDVLFHVAPALNLGPAGLLYDFTRRRILRPPGYYTQPGVYRLATHSIQNGRQSRFVAARKALDGTFGLPYLEVPRNLQQLPALARSAVENVPPEDKLAQIEALGKYLTDPALFAYTLRPPRRDDSMDAIEDFLTHNRQGHCEYFATAMALMLRSVEIPSRMVIGFKGDEYNALGSFYQVRQLHAHAWVEAYLSYDQLPATMRANPKVWKEGAWFTVDPSPVAMADQTVATTTLQFLSIRQMTDYMRFLWSSYVMGMDAHKQQQSIYATPVAAIRKFADRNFWGKIGARLKSFFRNENAKPGSIGNGWINLRVIAVALFTIAVLAGITRLLQRRAWRHWLRGKHGTREITPPPRAETLLYGRLERMLGKLDFHRPEGQTPREYAAAAGGLLARSPATRAVADLPLGVVDAFYRLRFAGRGLDRPELETLEQSLARLEAALRAAEPQESAARG